MNTYTPIIFCHYGNSEYLPYVFEAVRLTNSEKDIVLLGDADNKWLESKGIKHYLFDDFEYGEKVEIFNKFYRLIQGKQHQKILELKGGKDWVNFVFKRWFYIYNFISSQGIKQFWHFDSDTMILAPLSSHEEKFKAYHCTEQCNGMCINGFISSPEIIGDYLHHINNLFQDNKFLAAQQKEFDEINPSFAFTEMRAYQEFKESMGSNIRTIRLNTIIDGTAFDDCICQDHDMEMEVFKTDDTSHQTFIKKVYCNQEGSFYCHNVKNKQFVKMNSLNLSWVHNVLFEITLSQLKKGSDRQFSTLSNQIQYVLDMLTFNDIYIQSKSNQSNITGALQDSQENQQEWHFTTPVAFLIFNRPETTARVFETIRQAKPPKLLIVADGPRSDRPDDVENCKAVRAIVEQIDWDCEVFRNYSEVNLGCRKRVITGLDWVFEQVEEAIILEDDCLPHPTFFRYCQELLEKYRNDTRIMMISGDNFQFGRNKTEYSYYFSRYTHVWGWATWKRSWSLFDESMQTWPELRDQRWLEHLFCNQQIETYWYNKFQGVYEGFNTWDYIWQFISLSHHGLTILPKVNLISNIGFGSGTNSKNIHYSSVSNMSLVPMDFPLNHPMIVIQHILADNFTEMTLFSQGSQHLMNVQKPKASAQNLVDLFNNDKYELVQDYIDADSQTPSTLYLKAIAEARLGLLNDAQQSLQRLLNNSPFHIKAQQLLKEINELSEIEVDQMIDFRHKIKSRKSLISELQGLSPGALTSPSGEITAQVDHLDRSEFQTVLQAFESDRIQDAFVILNEKKAKKALTQGIDYLRSICFLRMGQPAAAIQSLYEELRYFSQHYQAEELLKHLVRQHPQYIQSFIQDAEFQDIYQRIQPYTMLSEARLYSLFNLAKKVCQENIPGNFVECGVAAGGSTALLATIIQRYTKQPRWVYAFDSFEGMPAPTEKDTSGGLSAEETGWGTGTCAATEASVREICNQLSVANIVQPVKGYFEETLPQMHDRVGMIAFLHMDGDWYESTKAILNNLYDRLSNHAYVQVDDYGFWEGCRQAVHEFFTQRHLEFELNKIDSTGVWFQCGENYKINPAIETSLIQDFREDDPVSYGIQSQMSQNERFQLYYALRKFLPVTTPIRFAEIGSFAGSSLFLNYKALSRLTPDVQGWAIEPGLNSQLKSVLENFSASVTHIRSYSQDALPVLQDSLNGQRLPYIFVDGDHSYEGVKQDIINYFPLLMSGGLMIFHDYLPPLDDRNRESILFHHGGNEPGIRQACQELMEDTYHCEIIELPLLYPEDPTQTQAFLPIIPGVFSTLRVYRKS